MLLAVAAASLVVAFQSFSDPEPELRDPAIITVSPNVGETHVRQTSVYAEVTPGNDAEFLEIGDRLTPRDEQTYLRTGNSLRVSYTPGAGKSVTAFPAGRVCARIDIWPVGTDRDANARPDAWCFTLT